MAKKQEEAEVDPRAPVESTWGGLVKWDCPFCPRDSFDRTEVEAHIANAHPEPSPSVTDAIAAESELPASVSELAPESPAPIVSKPKAVKRGAKAQPSPLPTEPITATDLVIEPDETKQPAEPEKGE
jgi:hypothetical protein